MTAWADTTASRCRYGDVAEQVWGDWDVRWEDSEADYQGHATILAEKDGRWSFYEWWYGSCSGCDGWEADGRSDAEIEREMRDTAMWFDDEAGLRRWLDMLEGNPRSNASMERGSALAFGIDFLSGGLRGRIDGVRGALGLPPLPVPE